MSLLILAMSFLITDGCDVSFGRSDHPKANLCSQPLFLSRFKQHDHVKERYSCSSPVWLIIIKTQALLASVFGSIGSNSTNSGAIEF